MRRFAVLVAGLPDESLFRAECEDRDPFGGTTAAILDVWGALAGKPHPKWTAKQRRRDRAEREAKKKSLLAEARAFNAAVLRK